MTPWYRSWGTLPVIAVVSAISIQFATGHITIGESYSKKPSLTFPARVTGVSDSCGPGYDPKSKLRYGSVSFFVHRTNDDMNVLATSRIAKTDVCTQAAAVLKAGELTEIVQVTGSFDDGIFKVTELSSEHYKFDFPKNRVYVK